MTASATELPFDSGQFDIVFTNKALHHVPEWQQAIDHLDQSQTEGAL